MRNNHVIAVLGLLLLPGITLAADPPKHEYPTQARVEYVFDCMQQLGGENYDTLYKCSCSVDYIADKLSYNEYVTLDTYNRGQRAGGERPEILREGELARGSRSALAQVKAEAADQCLINDGQVNRTASDNG